MVRPNDTTAAEALTRIARSADLPYFRVDAERNVVEMSPALERLTGFRADEILGRSCLRVHRCTECLRGCGVFDDGVVTAKELELYRSDGTPVRVSKSGRAFFDDDGRVVGAIEVVEALDDLRPRENDDKGARAVRTALERAHYNRSAAARMLGISRTTLWRRMKTLGLLPDEPSRRT